MARAFLTASSEGLYVTSSPISGTPLTMAFWFKANNITVNYFMGAIVDGGGSGGDRFGINASGGVGGDPIRSLTKAGGLTAIAATTTGYSADTWHHACAVWVSSFDRSIFLDGGSKGTNTTGRAPSVSNISIAMLYGNASSRFDGSIAEFSLWDTNLTDAEVLMSSKGYSPLLIRPQNLALYVPLIRDNDEDIVGGLSFSVDGTPTIEPHPRVLYPRK